jgi:hypothetical protein
MLSIIIPSYKCKYVARTVEDIYAKAKGPIEVIVVLDGYWPVPPIQSHKTLTIIHKGINSGMRNSINMGAVIAKGEYLLKCDDHVMFSYGFDEALTKDCAPNQLSVPSRFMLDVEAWQPRREAIEYEYLAYPYRYLDRVRYGMGLHSKKWLGEKGCDPPNMGPQQFYFRENARKDIKIDEIMIIHGSCWMMPREHFFKIGGLEDAGLFKSLYMEPQEICLKTLLTGGRCVVNKNAWYAHMHKTSTDGSAKREYELDLHVMRDTERFGTALWMNDKWAGATKPMKWLIDKFWPIPGWPDDWEQQQIEWEKKYPIQLEDKYELKGI